MNRQGMALVIVLSLSMFLLVFGGAYIQANRHNKPINERIGEHTQADFIAQGVLQLAILKFKKRPAEFYWAYKAKKKGFSSTYYDTYVTNDPNLNGRFTDYKGLIYHYRTDWKLATNSNFTNDAIVITVIVDQEKADGTVLLSRQMESTLQAERKFL